MRSTFSPFCIVLSFRLTKRRIVYAASFSLIQSFFISSRGVDRSIQRTGSTDQ